MGNQYLFGRPKRNGIKTKIMVAALLLAVGLGVWMNLPDEEEGSNLTVNAGTAVNGKENNHYDIDGNERFIRVTDIPFPLISEADQESFTEGMVIETEEALDEILQDFES